MSQDNMLKFQDMVEQAPKKTGLVVDYEKLKTLIFTAIIGRREKYGIFKDGYKPPELPFIDLAKDYGVKTNNPSFALHAVFQYITAVMQDDSTLQLERAAHKEDFQKYKWLYEPQIVTQADQNAVFKAAKELVKPSQNEESLKSWKHNSEVIVKKYGGDLKNLFEEYEFDAIKLLEQLENKEDVETGFKRFGPKVARLFLLWADHYGLAGRKLERMNELGIQIDFQIIRLCVQTGVLKLDKPTHTTTITRMLIKVFQQFCLEYCNNETGLTPQYISETLWYAGHKGCNKLDHGNCPLEDMCTSLNWRLTYDRTGKIYPFDLGRYKIRSQIRANLIKARQRLKGIAYGQVVLPLGDEVEGESELERIIKTFKKIVQVKTLEEINI